jgi:pimeloyl-ACP methyl ester carboxylesterase
MLNLLPYESFAKGSVDFKYHEPSEQIKKEAFERAIRTPKYAAYECFTEFTKNYNIREKVSQITVPTLIIVGEKDKATPVEMSQYLNREIRGSKIQIIIDSEHKVMVEKSKEFNEIVEEFIR